MAIGSKFGQQEPLTRRLHNLVRSYPKGLGVLKEFIQNADDSEADEIIFFIDEQLHDVSGLPSCMQWLHQTPALLVYNNKPFTDDDVKGIQHIGQSGKSDSVGKTGRFGLGFNACYNVTDVPSFFTRNTLYFFDPHYITVPGASVESPGRCFSAEDLIDEEWPLLDSFSHFIENEKGFEGTVFRLPFRTEEQEKTSQIKRDAFTVGDVLDAVQELQDIGSVILLFLKHVRRLKVECRSQDGSLMTLLSMEANNPIEISKSRSEINGLLNSSDPERILTYLSEKGNVFSSCLHEYTLEINGEVHSETWRVVDGFFTDSNQEVIKSCRKMIENEEKALPYAGAAWLLNSDRNPGGSLFCFLPVPMHTSLPVQINGYFDLDDSRQNMFLDLSSHGSARLRVKWNRTLLETSVAQAYVRLLEDLRSDLGTKEIISYYDAFPAAAHSDSSWEGWLTSAFYRHASSVPLFRCSDEIKWSELARTRALPEELISIGNELIAEGFLPILDPALPPHIEMGFKAINIDIPQLTPNDLRIQLKEDHDVDCAIDAAPRLSLRKRDNIIQILRFCLSEASEDELCGLPLVIDGSGNLRTLGLTEEPLYIAEKRWDMDVFWDCQKCFVHPNFVRDVGLSAIDEVNLFSMNSTRFIRKLTDYIATQVDDGKPQFNKSGYGTFTDAWLKSVFSRLLESNLEALTSDLNEIPLIPDQSLTLHAMGSAATPLLFNGKIELRRSLLDLNVPLVTGVSKELSKLLNKFSSKQDCLWSVTPRDLIDTLTDQSSEILQEFETFTNTQRNLLDYFSKEDNLTVLKELPDRKNKLQSMKLFPTVSGELVNLLETTYVSQDFKFPTVGFDVVLLNDGMLHKWRKLFLLLGARELSRPTLIREVLLPGFEDLDDRERVKATEWLRDNLSGAQSEDTDLNFTSLFEKVRATPIISCEDGVLRKPTEVYQPDSTLASDVFKDQAAFPDMIGAYSHQSSRWLEFFRQLDMPTEPLFQDVVDYIKSLVESDPSEDKVQRLQVVYDFIKNHVDMELRSRDDLSNELASMLGELSEIKWIPLRQKPGELFCFKIPENMYARPSEVYFPRVGQLVASQACITVLRPEPSKLIREAMGFPLRPPVDVVLDHFKEVLDACTLSETIPKDTLLTRVLGQIYRYLGGETPSEIEEVDDDVKAMAIEATMDLQSTFHDLPCIWDQEQKCFLRPDRVFKDNVRYMEPWRRTIYSTEDAIERGYNALGRKQEPTVDDWKQVLLEIAESSESIMANDHIRVILEVVRHIVKELTDNDNYDEKVLVLTRDGRMLEAGNVFLADAPWYEDMLDSQDIPILESSLSGLWGIQHALSIRSLATSLDQRLTEHSIDSDLETECEECARLEKVIQSRELILGLQRLLRHEDHEVPEETLAYLHVVKVRCVNAICTGLYLRVNGSERFLGDVNADFYWDHETPEAMLAETRRRYFCDDLAELLNRSLQGYCLHNLAPLVHILRSKPIEISGVLDDLKIRQYIFDQEVVLEEEEGITPQLFPNEVEHGDEQQAIESDMTEFNIVNDSEDNKALIEDEKQSSSLDDYSFIPSQLKRSQEGSTASAPQGIEANDNSGQREKEKQLNNSSGNSFFSDTRTPPSISSGKKTDLERRESSSSHNDNTGSSTSSQRQSNSQRRLVSYVSPSGPDNVERQASNAAESHRLRVGETAVEIVIRSEQKKGREARSMDHVNAGYDVVSEGEDGIRYIEVKGTEAAWGERGVAMTPTQFFYSREQPNRDCWLYVVEEVFSTTPLIHEIQNPSANVDRFIFDGGWRQIAENTSGVGVEIPIPAPGDHVVMDNEMVGVVESTLVFGKFPLVIYRDLANNQCRKRLADLTIRTKEL